MKLRTLVASATLVLSATGPVLLTASPASAYTPWACGTASHSHSQSGGSASLSSTVQGCGLKVAIDCRQGSTPSGTLLGNLVFTGDTSTRNCSPGWVWDGQGHQMGTNW